MAKKKLLSEAQVRKFMGLANIDANMCTNICINIGTNIGTTIRIMTGPGWATQKKRK